MKTSNAIIAAALLALSLGCGGATPQPDAHPAERPGHTHGHGHHGGQGGADDDGFHHAFKGAEAWSKRFDDPARDAWQKPKAVVALMEIQPGMRVADIGAGTGYFLEHLAAAVGAAGKVEALDIEPDMVEWMQKRIAEAGWDNTSARRIAPDDPGLDPAGVDRVLIVNTWHHISGRRAYAAKLKEALAPGGAVYIVDYTLASRRGPPAQHRLAPEKVIAELRAGGLDAELVESSLPHQYIVVGR